MRTLPLGHAPPLKPTTSVRCCIPKTLFMPAPQTSIPLCPPLSVALGGSAVELYTSDSFYDDLLWAAAWMYKATGAQSQHFLASALMLSSSRCGPRSQLHKPVKHRQACGIDWHAGHRRKHRQAPKLMTNHDQRSFQLHTCPIISSRPHYAFRAPYQP